MVRLGKDYRFIAPDGTTVGLTDLFQGRRQLAVYHFMREPGQDSLCGGCASFTDNLADQSHLNARNTTLILMSRAPREEIGPVRRRFSWSVPWYSAHGSDFYPDLGLGGGFGLSVLLRDGDETFRTYFTTGRGVEAPRRVLRRPSCPGPLPRPNARSSLPSPTSGCSAWPTTVTGRRSRCLSGTPTSPAAT
jgi:hypothetical protein